MPINDEPFSTLISFLFFSKDLISYFMYMSVLSVFTAAFQKKASDHIRDNCEPPCDC